MLFFAQATSDSAQTTTQSGTGLSDLGALYDSTIEFLSTRGVDFALNLLAAIAVFVIGRWVARMLTNLARKLLKAAKVEETLVGFLCNLLHAALVVFVVIAALGNLGVETTSFAAILAAAGLAIGFALQGSLSNFASGVMISLFRPFKVGDLVEVAGSMGIVKEIAIFNTTLTTLDNVKIIIPNGSITGGTITNYSAMPTRRVDMMFGCSYGDDILKAKRVLEDIVNNDPRILKDPAPQVAVAELGDSSINFHVRPWVKAEHYWDVNFHVHEQVKLRFDEHDISIPYPTQDLNVTLPKPDAST